MQNVLNHEITDLRKSPYKELPALQIAYCRKTTITTLDLPIGTQARFITAATVAADLGHPLNTLLTIRWASLFSDNGVNGLRVLHTPERIDYLVERLRKWIIAQRQPPYYIWARECAGPAGEHWHIAFHMPTKKRTNLARYIAKLTGEPLRDRPRTAPQLTEGEFACGELASWHLAGDTRPDQRGFHLAAYLGKGEPSERMFRGTMRGNDHKPVRGKSFGGNQPDGKYDAAQGQIEGTACRKDRFFIAKKLQDATRVHAKSKPGAAKKH